MIDPACAAASWSLWIVAALLLLAYALPLFFVPLAWARVFKWQVPPRNDLAEYLGRCLGGVAIALVFACFRAAPHPRAHPQLFELLVMAGALLTVAHVWGALAKRQPWTETVEIALYAGLTALFLWLRVTL